MRNLVVCCDGTWNTANNMDGGTPAPTNVYKFHTAVSTSDSQLKYYRSGVGTDGGLVRRLVGGALGYGINDDIKSPYKWLCENYRGEGKDQIFLVGFSRGAYTARSLAGIVGEVGLCDHTDPDMAEPDKWSAVERAYERYRNRTGDIDALDARAVPIRFLGVFDTVGALGIPPDLNFTRRVFGRKKYQFHDTALSEKVQTARHALAIDERRLSFTPTLWTKFGDDCDVEQVWFPGVHADVGGGYAETGLGDITLDWMIEEAKKCGLDFQDRFRDQLKPNERGLLHESFQGGFKVLRSQPREVPDLNDDDKVHESARVRAAKPPISQSTYWPTATLTTGSTVTRAIRAKERWSNTGIYLEEGKSYSFEATGEWLDADLKSGPEGVPNSLHRIGHAISAGIGGAKRLLLSIDCENSSRATLARRNDQWPWFSLIGFIANGYRDLPDGGHVEKLDEPPQHQTFLISSQTDAIVPKASGYLYCYANDAWHFYQNNRGKVVLEIRCD
ncbi:MAG: DUF2235 domain-containing protein [Paracoccaceae bacterium]